MLPQVPEGQSCQQAHDFLGRREGRPTELRRIVSGGAIQPLRGHLALQGPPSSGRLHHRPGAYLPISDSGPGCPSLFLPRPASQADSGRLRGVQRRPQTQLLASDSSPAHLGRLFLDGPASRLPPRESPRGPLRGQQCAYFLSPGLATAEGGVTPPADSTTVLWSPVLAADPARPGHSSQISCDSHSEKVRKLGIHEVEGNAVMDLNPGEVVLRLRPAHRDVQTGPDQQIPALESPRNSGHHHERVQLPGPSPVFVATLPILGTDVT